MLWGARGGEGLPEEVEQVARYTDGVLDGDGAAEGPGDRRAVLGIAYVSDRGRYEGQGGEGGLTRRPNAREVGREFEVGGRDSVEGKEEQEEEVEMQHHETGKDWQNTLPVNPLGSESG